MRLLVLLCALQIIRAVYPSISACCIGCNMMIISQMTPLKVQAAEPFCELEARLVETQIAHGYCCQYPCGCFGTWAVVHFARLKIVCDAVHACTTVCLMLKVIIFAVLVHHHRGRLTRSAKTSRIPAAESIYTRCALLLSCTVPQNSASITHLIFTSTHFTHSIRNLSSNQLHARQRDPHCTTAIMAPTTAEKKKSGGFFGFVSKKDKSGECNCVRLSDSHSANTTLATGGVMLLQ